MSEAMFGIISYALILPSGVKTDLELDEANKAENRSDASLPAHSESHNPWKL